jgi:hypothetical protein
MNTLLGRLLDRSLEHYPANARRIWYLALTVIADAIPIVVVRRFGAREIAP